MKKPLYGYIGMTADFLHIGHINAINQCKEHCQRVIIGIMTDDCVKSYKGKKPITPQEDRDRLIKQLRTVYKTMFQDSFEFPHYVLRLKENYGSDFVIFDTEEHSRQYVDILIKLTPSISSTRIKVENPNLSQLPL